MMPQRPRRTTTLGGPNRLVLGAATAGLVALASAGTALLVLTGTSTVTPGAAPAPLPSSSPLTRSPGVVVLPPVGERHLVAARKPRAARHAVAVAPVALAFTDAPVVTAPVVVAPVPALPALVRTATPAETDREADLGRRFAWGHWKGHLKGHAKGHAWQGKTRGADAEHGERGEHGKKHGKQRKAHGERAGWSYSGDRGDD